MIFVALLIVFFSAFFNTRMEANHINYIEFKAKDLNEIKRFYSAVFNWEFTDYGPSYAAFQNSGLEGGFEVTEESITNGALVVLYHQDLQTTLSKVVEHGGAIVQDIFEFPGGKRFHFTDPSGNELAVWSDK
jgi:predicted enzyme related to lactoylglutathione lyase